MRESNPRKERLANNNHVGSYAKKNLVVAGFALLAFGTHLIAKGANLNTHEAPTEPQTYSINCYQVCASDLYGREVGLNVPLCKKEDSAAVRNRMQNVLGLLLKEVELCPSTCSISKKSLESSAYCLKNVESINDEHIERWKDASPAFFKRNNANEDNE